MRKIKTILSVAILFICFAGTYAQDWPQYLGPNRNSISDETGIFRSWPATGPEVLWSVNVGIGYGGPVIKDGKVYLLDRDDKVGDTMRCFDLNTGKELWSFGYEAAGSVMFPGSRSVPIIDDKHVYSCGPYGDLYCIDINTHNPVWKKNVWSDFGGPAPTSERGGGFPTWAISQCPLIYGDLLIIASQAPEAGVVAYNKESGDLVWKTPSLGPTGYVSPTIVKIDGNDHVAYVTASGGGRGQDPVPGVVAGIDPLSGKILWKFEDWLCRIPIPTPVEVGDNKLLITGGYELGALMIQVEKKADGTYGTKELFRTEEFGDQTKPPLLINGYFYAQFGTNSTRDGLTCMSMDGEIMWKTKREPDFNKGSIIIANGLMLATDGAKSLYLIDPDPSGYKQLASVEILEEGTGSGANQNWAPLALSGGKLLIRDQKRMLCVKVGE